MITIIATVYIFLYTLHDIWSTVENNFQKILSLCRKGGERGGGRGALWNLFWGRKQLSNSHIDIL